MTSAVALVWISSLLGCAGQTTGRATAAATRSRMTDLTSTRAFLAARRLRASSIEGRLQTNEAAIERFVAGIKCARIAASAPHGAQFDELDYDALVATEIRMEQINTPALTRFVGRVDKLRWTKAALTRLVRRLDQEEQALAKIMPLDICAMFEAWARNRYRAIPSSAQRFQREIVGIVSQAGTHCKPVPPNGQSICSLRGSPMSTVAAILRFLRPFENHRQSAMVSVMERNEREIAMRTRVALVAATSKLTRVLNLDSFSLRLYIASLSAQG
jgi:hypothetical protein